MLAPHHLAVLFGLLAAVSLVSTQSVCDIYAIGKTPCVAAHSTTRALYGSYNGALYQVTRGSDNATKDIGLLAAGGVAKASTQDSFCAGTTCLISIIYDQSGKGNHLRQAPPGSAGSGPSPGGYDDLTLATGAPVMVNGSKAYGVFIQPQSGYRIDKTSGVALLDQPEGIYAVLDGTHFNSDCCFDYGNVEANNSDNGNGHMETIFFGGKVPFNGGTGSGSGPWIMSDLENGVFSGANLGYNGNDPTINYRFTTAIVKGEPNHWSIRGGDATSGSLSTFYNGSRPNYSGYNPMVKEGAIGLGVGGDNSNGGQGTFYEGALTQGYPLDNIEAYVQANIVAAKYTTTSLTSGPAVNVGSSISFRVTTPGYTNRYITHNGSSVITAVVSSSSSTALKQQASWIVRTGLGNSGCVSFESKDTSGSFIRHNGRDYTLNIGTNDGSKDMHEDATFCPQAGLNGQGNSIRSWNFPTRFFRHNSAKLFIASNGGPNFYDGTASYNDDTSFVIGNSFA